MKEATDIIIVLDRSGSMDAIRDDTIGGVNRFIEDQKNVPGAATFSLFQFDHEFECVANAIPIKDAKPLSKSTFVPRGTTCLFGAVGRAIRDTGDRLNFMHEHNRPNKVVFVIVTDGEENSSHDHEWSSPYTAQSIREAIERQTNVYKWQFVYIGANQDAFANARDIGISAPNTMNYTANEKGTSAIYASLSKNVSSLRCMAKADMSWEAEDRTAQEDAK